MLTQYKMYSRSIKGRFRCLFAQIFLNYTTDVNAVFSINRVIREEGLFVLYMHIMIEKN